MGKRTIAVEAENAHLREYIAASKDVIAAVTVAEIQAENDRIRRACEDALAAMREGRPVRSVSCQWCGESWLTPDGETFETAMAVSSAHARACAKNPLALEIAALRGAIIDLHALQLQRHRDEQEAWAIRQTANDLSEPFSDERVMARLAEMRGSDRG